MITQSEFLRRLSSYTHITLGDLMNKANRLREADVIRRGGRGLSAVKIEPDDALMIILAIMSGASANECPAAAEKLAALPLLNVDGSEQTKAELKEIRDDAVILLVPTEFLALGRTLEEILADPHKAEIVESFSVDYINNHAVVTWADGREDHFGKKGSFNSRVTITLSGNVLVKLSRAIKIPLNGHLEWTRKSLKISAEQGEEAAAKWIEENPFIEEK